MSDAAAAWLGTRLAADPAGTGRPQAVRAGNQAARPMGAREQSPEGVPFSRQPPPGARGGMRRDQGGLSRDWAPLRRDRGGLRCDRGGQPVSAGCRRRLQPGGGDQWP